MSFECFDICSGINANADRLGLSVFVCGRLGLVVFILPMRPHTCTAAALHNDSIPVIAFSISAHDPVCDKI